MKRDFFPPLHSKALHSFIEGSALHDHLIPSLILLAARFLTAQKYTLILSQAFPFPPAQLRTQLKAQFMSSSLALLSPFVISPVF